MVRFLGLEELFEGRHFDRGIIALCVRWYLRFKLSFLDLVLLCHKFVRRSVRWQHGQRGRERARIRAIAMQTDVIEFGA